MLIWRGEKGRKLRLGHRRKDQEMAGRDGRDGKKGGGTPGERKLSRQEEIKDLDNLWAKIKEEFRQNTLYMENKLGEVQDLIDKKIEGAVGELSIKIQDLTAKSNRIEESNKKLQKEMREQKKETLKVKEELGELCISQDKIWDNLAMADMRLKQLHLKFRGVAEDRNEDIRGKMIKELSNWLGIREEEMAATIVNVYRMTRPKHMNASKFLGDCLVIFNSLEMKNLVLRKSYNNRLRIDGRPIIIYKEIPVRLLRKREGYKQVAAALRRTGVPFRWEFPEGISFFYKEKKFRLLEAQEADKFLRRYEKELGKVKNRLRSREEEEEGEMRTQQEEERGGGEETSDLDEDEEEAVVGRGTAEEGEFPGNKGESS